MRNYQRAELRQLSFPEEHITVTPTPEPFVKWAGGKTQLLAQFKDFFPASYQRYYEPFLGGGAVFLALCPPQATLNDANPTLITAYRHIQNQLEALLPLLQTIRRTYHALALAEQEDAFYRLREEYNQLPTGSLEKTALFIVLNKTCYNGLYRENARGQFNVPFGRYINPVMFREENLRAIARVLQGVELLNATFGAAVETARRGDFVYCDPPYMPVSTTASFTKYTKDDFGPARQTELAHLVHDLTERGVLVMVSNSDTLFIRELYQDLYIGEVRAGRVINSNPARRGKINELVITNYLPRDTSAFDILTLGKRKE